LLFERVTPVFTRGAMDGDSGLTRLGTIREVFPYVVPDETRRGDGESD